MIVEDERHIFW